jgi:hypothetical protein
VKNSRGAIYAILFLACFSGTIAAQFLLTGVGPAVNSALAAEFPSGAIVFVDSGACPAGYTEVAGLDGKYLLGTVNANGNVGGSGGSLNSSSITAGTPSGSLSGNVANESTHTHSVTSNVTVADHSAHTHSVTSNVSVNDHASHTHTYTEVPNHVHVQNINSATMGGLNGYAVDTSTNSSSATGYSTANPTGGVAIGTTNGPGAALTHTVNNNAVTSGNPSATLTHSPTNNAVTSGAGAAHNHGVGTLAFAGTELSTHLHTISPTFFRLIGCKKD